MADKQVFHSTISVIDYQSYAPYLYMNISFRGNSPQL